MQIYSREIPHTYDTPKRYKWDSNIIMRILRLRLYLPSGINKDSFNGFSTYEHRLGRLGIEKALSPFIRIAQAVAYETLVLNLW